MAQMIVGPEQTRALHGLRAAAAAAPVAIQKVAEAIQTPKGKAAHMDHMTRQTVVLPPDWLVTLSIETGHPCGACRHLSMATADGRLPHPVAVQIVAEELGWVGEVTASTGWIEPLLQGGNALHVIQPVTVVAEASDAGSKGRLQ